MEKARLKGEEGKSSIVEGKTSVIGVSDKGPVYLTNDDVNKPIKVVDDYDDRSLIENGTFRTGKPR